MKIRIIFQHLGENFFFIEKMGLAAAAAELEASDPI